MVTFSTILPSHRSMEFKLTISTKGLRKSCADDFGDVFQTAQFLHKTCIVPIFKIFFPLVSIAKRFQVRVKELN